MYQWHRRTLITSFFVLLGILLVFISYLSMATPLVAMETDSEPVITGMTGKIEIVSIPANLNGGNFISQTHIRLMREGSGFVAASMPDFINDAAYHDPALPIAFGDNTFGNAIVTPYSGPGLPAVGTEIYSILLYFDPNVSGLPFNLEEGIAQSVIISFDCPIIGVFVTSGALNTIDDIFSPSGVAFPMVSGRDMEFNYDGDNYSISPDRKELSLTMFSHNGGILDEMRIILGTDGTTAVSLQSFSEVTNSHGQLVGLSLMLVLATVLMLVLKFVPRKEAR